MSCPCDRTAFPPLPEIPAGLRSLPRQIATFAEFRGALLSAVGREPALAGWRPGDPEDFGTMLLEWWAYVGDVIAFYQQVIANEAYLPTALRRPSLRQLVTLLGYVPRPAIAATVELAAFAEGRRPIALPAGTAFLSDAFDGEAPQLFELDATTTIHPRVNEWTLARVRPTTFGAAATSLDHLLLEPRTARIRAGDVALLRLPAAARVVRAAAVAAYEGADGGSYVRVELDAAVAIPGGTAVAATRLLRPTAAASLWKLSTLTGDPAVIHTTGGTLSGLVLDGLHRQIRAGSLVLLSKGDEFRWFTVVEATESLRQLTAGATSQLTDAAGNSAGSITAPAVRLPVTVLTLDAGLNDAARKPSASADWAASQAAEITVHHGLVDAGALRVEAKTTLAPEDSPLRVDGRVEPPADAALPGRFLLHDRDDRGAAVTGTLVATTGALSVDATSAWDAPLASPVRLYGNVIRASRGETVRGEVLGSGDASIANQSFTLAKKPLTYLPAPTAGNESGVAGTLRVYVNRILWAEVPSFFGAPGDAQVYTVRQNDEGEAVVTFGDGVRGARVPTGVDNVVADYRFGAGAASPPAGAIHQLAGPVPGLRAARNPVAAAGGADAEGPDGIRTNAPRSALLLGRAVSIADMEAAAATVGGVRVARAEWRWNTERQRPVAQIHYVGEPGLESLITQRLRGLTDPAAPIDVARATPVPTTLAIDVEVDPRFIEDDVLAAVRLALAAPGTGLLAPERVGIGRPLFRSRIFHAVLAVPGATAVHGIWIDGDAFPEFARSPGAGHYFDLEGGALLLNGEG